MNMEPYASKDAYGLVVTMGDGSWFTVLKSTVPDGYIPGVDQ